MDMSGEAEELYRWASIRTRSIQNAVPALEKARKKCDLVRGLARKMKIDQALELKAKIDHDIWQALGAMVDPSKSNDEKVELARRIFSQEDSTKSVMAAGKPDIWNRYAEQQEWRMSREKIEALATEVLKSKRLLVQSDEVLAALADKGWTAAKLAAVWDEYLGEVLTKGKINQKREAIRDFMEFVRGLEPKVVFEMDADLDTMSEDGLKTMQTRLAQVLIGAAAKE